MDRGWHLLERIRINAVYIQKMWKRKANSVEKRSISVRPAESRISLGIGPVGSESLLCTLWVAKDPSFLHADSKDSDQIGRMPRLI